MPSPLHDGIVSVISSEFVVALARLPGMERDRVMSSSNEDRRGFRNR
jgi:hypothetical protein